MFELHTSLVVQETVIHSVNKGATVYAAFLDTKKAFDTVWTAGLMYKLYKAGINRRAWRLIKSGYTNFQCTAFIAGKVGEWFLAEQGVHQGAPLSMGLYCVFINDLLQQLRQCQFGIKIGEIDVTSPAHADDIALLALYKVCLNGLLKICHEYSKNWRFRFNELKTEFMMWGSDHDPKVKVNFGNEILNQSKTCKHMGVILCTDSRLQREKCSEKIGAGKTALSAARGLGSHNVPVTPCVLSKLYWSVSVPKMTYGYEVTPVSNTNLNELEDAHRQSAKIVQGLPLNLPKPPSLATLGWMSMKSYIAMIKIMFMIRTLCLPDGNVYRNIIKYRVDETNNSSEATRKYVSPVEQMLNLVREYNIGYITDKCISRGNFGDVERWKIVVKKVLWEKEIAMWRGTCILYPELNVYTDCVKNIAMSIWWRVARASTRLQKQISGTLAVMMGGQPRGIQCNLGVRMCGLCNDRCRENPEHVLFECQILESFRDRAWSQVLSCMPRGMVSSIGCYNNGEKLRFLLLGLRCESVITEWQNIFEEVAIFVYAMYSHRKEKYDMLIGIDLWMDE